VKEYPKPAVGPIETPNECLVAEICIDEYLWSLYERTPKIDTNKETERIKETVKKKANAGHNKNHYEVRRGDFTWKDLIAAQSAGMSLKDYVIGGLDRGFKLKGARSPQISPLKWRRAREAPYGYHDPPNSCGRASARRISGEVLDFGNTWNNPPRPFFSRSSAPA
jgi:hypothetical protein